ncbi:MAG: hypothetical protein V2A67_10810 [Bacteroidota bacterium]
MKRILCTGIVVLVACLNLRAQVDPAVIKSWPGESELIAADLLGQVYIVRTGKLTKYSETGDSLFTWSDPASGSITSIDASDPLRILLYHGDFNLVRFLNNRLAPLSDPIKLDNLNVTDPLALATSRQGGFWILDGTTFRLRYFDHQLNLQVESSPLIFTEIQPTTGVRLIESADRLWLQIPGEEVRQYDLFGNLIRRIPVKALAFSLYEQQLVLIYPHKITLSSDLFKPEILVTGWKGIPLLEACLLDKRLLIRTAKEVLLINR